MTRGSEADDGTVTLALSSEEPVETFFGTEVLLHGPENIDMSRAQPNGLPVLLEHTPMLLAGRLVEIEVGNDRKLRGKLKYTKRALGAELKQDIADGIRQEVSVGYTVEEYQVDKSDAAHPIYRATRWTPAEVSFVAIPADVTVGVGRSLPAPEPPPQPSRGTPEVVVMSDTITTPAGASLDDTRQAERDRLGALTTFAREAKGKYPKASPFIEGRMASWIQSGAPVEKAKGDVFEEVARLHESGAVPPAEPELTRKEFDGFSLARALKTLINGEPRKGFEFEVSDEIAKQQNRQTRGILVPMQVKAGAMLKQMAAAGTLHTRANELTVGTAADGGYLKFTEYAGFLDLLRSRMVTFSLGVRYIPGLVGDLQWVKKTAGTTGGWNTELNNQANSKWTLATVTLAPKIYEDAVITSRQLWLQSVESLEALIRDEIAQNHAVAMETVILKGGGTSEPVGISATSGIGDVAGGTNGLQPTVANIWELYTDVATANADSNNSAIVTHPLGKARLAQTAEFSGATGGVLWKLGTGGNDALIGYPARTTTAVPSGQTKGTSTDCYYIYFGDFAQVVLGEWGSLEVIPDMITLGPAKIKLMSIQNVDVGVLYPAAFSVMKDARP